DNFTHAISRITFDRICKPLASACQRLINNRASIEIKTIEDITHGRVFGLGALNPALGLLLHAMDHVFEIRSSISLEADNFSVKQSRGGAKRLVGNQQFGKLFGKVHPITAMNSYFSFIQRNHGA